MQALLDMIDSQFLGNVAQDYLGSAVVFLAVLVGLPIAKAVILRHLKAVAQRTANDLDDLLHELLQRIVGQLVYLSSALYCAALFLTLPDGLGRLLQILFVIILTLKAAQVRVLVLAPFAVDRSAAPRDRG